MNRIDENAFRSFDTLPDAANVRLAVVAALFAISPATVWRWTQAGKLPEPSHIGGVTFWSVKELREVLRNAGRGPNQGGPLKTSPPRGGKASKS